MCQNRKASYYITILILLYSCFASDLTDNDNEQIRKTSQCSLGFFPCNSSERCIEQRKNCDGKQDCEDGSDEWECVDVHKKDFFNSLFSKRPDSDREKQVEACEMWPSPEECKCSGKSVFCEHRNLEEFPSDLPSDLEELDLSANPLLKIRWSDVPFLPHLDTLIMSHSEVVYLDTDVFRNLPALVKLYLIGNYITHLRNNTFLSNSRLIKLIISHNPLSELSPRSFSGLSNLEELDLRNCRIESLPIDVFASLTNLRSLWLEGNRIRELPPLVFRDLRKLTIFSIARNNLQEISSDSFGGLTSLRTLSLADNSIRCLEPNLFSNVRALYKLNLHHNNLDTIKPEAFNGLNKLESLDLADNPFRRLPKGILVNLTSLQHVYFDDFSLCSYALHVRVCEPRGDGISSIANLLANIVLRVSVWIVATVACVGNIFVLIGRSLLKEVNDIHSFYIKNLALADLIMGIYLFIIAGYDVSFRGEYILHDQKWRRSWQCTLCGVLSTISSEGSVLILVVITLDRYVSVLYPLIIKRRTIRFAIVCMSVMWVLAIFFAVLPLLHVNSYGKYFYGHNGVCLPIHIHDTYSRGWEYSIFLYGGLNMMAFVFILYAYLVMFFTIMSSKVGLRSTQQAQDRTIAKRFAFIVGTDMLCWVPIVFIKFLALAGVSISADLYAWVAIFLLPVNSALNPVIYTLTTKLFRQQMSKYVYRWRAGVFPVTGNNSDNSSTTISLSSLLVTRGSKRVLITTFSESDHQIPGSLRCSVTATKNWKRLRKPPLRGQSSFKSRSRSSPSSPG